MIVMFYKVTTHTALVNTEPLLLGEYRVGFLQASGHIFISQSIHNFVFLFKYTLFDIYC